MTEPSHSPPHTATTQSFLRCYVLMSQYLDRCLDDTRREALSEKEFQRHLSETRTNVVDLLSTNRVVQGKVETEYLDVKNLGGAYLVNPGDIGSLCLDRPSPQAFVILSTR